MLLEGRAPIEFVSLLAALPWLARLPRGDGHPVMVFPGMAPSDLTTVPLRRFLRSLGYVAQAWGQGFNFGPRRGVLERCARRRARALADRHRQPVSLIGWSLGGIYARELAKLHPTATRCVVTLGTPFTGHPKATNAWRIYELLSGKVGDAELMAQIRQPPPVPTTSIYSRSDGIVAWRCSLNDAGAAGREHRGAGEPRRHGHEPARAVRRRRSPRAADRRAGAASRSSGARRWFFRTALPTRWRRR